MSATKLLDILFVGFHSGLILFNLFGWMWERTARWNLLTLGLTGTSWFGLGYWYGWGYCICTDWHWNVLQAQGVEDVPNSYVKYLLERFFGLDLHPRFVAGAVAGFFIQALIISIWVNVRRKQETLPQPGYEAERSQRPKSRNW